MEFVGRIRDLAEKVNKSRQFVKNETHTKQSLILPFIQELGYSVFEFNELEAEYGADVKKKGFRKVDYAVKRDGNPLILIECKSYGHKLEEQEMEQLRLYYTFSKARIGILTDGIEYKFFIDLDTVNVMDTSPFFTFNVLEFTDTEAEILRMFRKSLDLDAILEWARRQKAIAAIKAVLAQEVDSPSEEFVNLLKERVGESVRGQLNAYLVKDALKQMIPRISSGCGEPTPVSNSNGPNEETSVVEEFIPGVKIQVKKSKKVKAEEWRGLEGVVIAIDKRGGIQVEIGGQKKWMSKNSVVVLKKAGTDTSSTSTGAG